MIAGHPITHFDGAMLLIIAALLLGALFWPHDPPGPGNRVSWGRVASARDADFLAICGALQTLITGAFGLPPHMVRA